MHNMERKKSFWDFFVNNHKFTYLLVFAMVGFGVLSAIQLPKESNPEVNIPFAVVSTPFPGASVEEVEELVTKKIEDSILGMDDLELVSSVSRSGISSISVEFDPKADADEVVADLKDKVDAVKPELPSSSEDPIVQRISFSDEAILLMSLSGPYETAQLKLYAEEIKDAIESIGGVNDVRIVGGGQREIQVLVDKAKLDTFGLSLSNITQSISQANSDIPIGSIQTGGENYDLRFAGRLTEPKQILSIPVGSSAGIPILVQDIAEVRDTFAQPASYSYLSAAQSELNPAVTLQVFKDPGGDITRLSDEIQLRARDIATREFPENVRLETTQDIAEYIRQDLGNLVQNGIATVIIVVLLLVVFIGWREALMAGLSIPLAFLASFIGLFYLDFSINFMTLFSLILALGILVDSAIVINEGLNKHRREGKNAKEAAYDTIREFQYPLISGTLTTVFAFVPMLLTGGIVGEFIKGIPITVTLVLVASLFIALAIVTTLSSRFFSGAVHEEKSPNVFKRWLLALKYSYTQYMRDLLVKKGRRRSLKWLLVLLFFIAYSLPATGLLRVEMFPSDDIDYFGIDFEKPFGTPLEQTRDDILTIANEIREDRRLKSLVVNVGSTLNLDGQGGTNGSHVASILINLSDERDENSTEIIEEFRKKLAYLQGLGDITISQASSGPPGSAAVEIKIEGNDLDTLDTLSNEFESLLSSINGTTNIRNSVVETNGQFVIEVNRIRAQQYGINATMLAGELRTAVNGIDATEVTLDGDDIDVSVRYRLNSSSEDETTPLSLTDISTIESLTIATPQGDIPVSSLATIRLSNSRASIERQDGKRVVRVLSGTDGSTTPLEIFAEVQKRMPQEISVPSGYTITLGGENEDTQESFADMLRAMILAIILIAGLMVLQFKSFRQALLIVITIPLALIGVFPGLLLMNQPISFPGVIGIVALAGIVVNNAIILIDRMNQNRREGMALDDAIIEAGEARMEPIVLTTITTVFGILPLALTQPIWASLGYAIIYGLMFSTVTTLIVIPLLYRKMEKKRNIDDLS